MPGGLLGLAHSRRVRSRVALATGPTEGASTLIIPAGMMVLPAALARRAVERADVALVGREPAADPGREVRREGECEEPMCEPALLARFAAAESAV